MMKAVDEVNPMSTEEGVAEGAGLTQRPTTLQWGGPNGVCTNMGSPGPLGSLTPSPATRSKIEQIKQWSLSTYKCTRQILAEKMGKGTRTVDGELEANIELLRETHQKYLNILRLAKLLTTHFYNTVATQAALGECFSDLAQKSPELQQEFLYNAETQKNLSKNGETLLGALNFFVSSLSTLCNKTIEDTLITIRHYENARLEFDAYRCDLEELSGRTGAAAQATKVAEARANFEAQKEKYERLRGDVQIKMKFLHENKVKVMHKQLLLLHNAVSAYFSGNQSSLEATLKQFNIKVKSPNSSSPSWLEQ
ncbi:arfaptin-2-like [Tropilaelaps mercedesae]|uniref:Arfaptin-2-like n=1 Tax=Tropilaelaps mercedesae TaxID=418985 RepID=A0A1V9XI09_9ACAR|nr:arfaptin-2-like [Tropilaelaps mercedesae]